MNSTKKVKVQKKYDWIENLSFSAAGLVSVSMQHSPSGTPGVSTSGQPHATTVHLLTTPDKTQTALGGCLQFYANPPSLLILDQEKSHTIH